MALGVEADQAFFDNGDPVLACVEAIARADVALPTGPRRAHVEYTAARIGVLYVAIRRRKVSIPSTPACDVHRESSVAEMDVTGPAGLARIGREIQSEL